MVLTGLGDHVVPVSQALPGWAAANASSPFLLFCQIRADAAGADLAREILRCHALC
jgi:hypothetical protein